MTWNFKKKFVLVAKPEPFSTASNRVLDTVKPRESMLCCVKVKAMLKKIEKWISGIEC